MCVIFFTDPLGQASHAMFKSYKSVTNGKFSYTLVFTKNVQFEIFNLWFYAMKEKDALAGQNLHLLKCHYVCVVECAGVALSLSHDRPESRNVLNALNLLQKET